MALISRATSILALHAFILSSWTMLTHSLPTEYCSSFNTASMAANLSIYQSNGLCSGFCMERSASFAIVQYQSCWCSDIVPDPSTNVATTECDSGCPGFGTENCGGNNLYGYLALGVAPAGTAGAQSQTTSQPKQQLSTPSPTAIQTVTADGTVKTVFVTPTVSATSNSATMSTNNKGGISTGAVVGIVIGVIGFVVVTAGIIVCLYLARRKRQQEPTDDAPSQRGSSAGMMGSPRREMGEAGSANWPMGDGAPLGRRSSKLMPVDPRLDPFRVGVYTRSKSTESINTLRDDHDYSRKVHQPKVLRATNPDPHVDDD